MKTTDYETGWSEHVWIEVKHNSHFAYIDKFRCKDSAQLLDEECLLIERSNFKHRGNETDELICYNRAFTPEKYKEVWDEWDNIKENTISKIKNLAKTYNINLKIEQ